MLKTITRRLAAALPLCLVAALAFAQVQPGQSPLSGTKGGTNNAYMQFAGPAASIKTFTLPNQTDTLATLGAIQTFTAAKSFNSGTFILNGSSSGSTTVNASASAAGTLTLPAATDTLVGRATTDTLTNKTLTSPTLTTPSLGAATATTINKVTITAPATGATLTIPDGVTLTGPAASGTAMTLGNAETVSGAKSFNSGTLIQKGSSSGTTTVQASATASGTLTLPAATDTLVGKATTDTFSNKTIDTASTNTIKVNGNSLSASAGTATLTLPNSTDTLIGRATTDTLTNKTLTSPVIGTIVNTGTLTLPTSTDTLVGRATTDTLTNKTLTSPTLTTPTLGAATATTINKVTITAPATGATLTIPDGVTLTGPAASGTAMTLGNAETVSGAKSFNSGTLIQKGSSSGTTTVQASATASGTLTLPAATDTLVGKATTDTLSNKTIDTASTNTIKVNGNSLSASAGTATLTLPNSTDTLIGRATTDTLTNKTLTSPVIGTIVNTGTLTLPTSTDTLVGRTTTDTLTNKTLDTASNTFKLNGTTFTTATNATAALNAMVGDAGSGGTKGLVPAPSAGDASASKFLKADGTWAVPSGGGGGSLSDTDRQNILLNRIKMAKALTAYQRFLAAFADGFKSATDDGISSGSSSNYTTTSGSGNVKPTVGSATAISQATGTTIGNMTSGGGIAAAFDGTNSQSSTTSAIATTTGSGGYVGKNYSSSPKQIAQVQVYAADGTGTIHWSDASNTDTITLQLYGKSTSPSSATDGTLLGSTSFANGPATTATATNPSPTITSSDQTTSWNYVWVAISSNGVGGASHQVISEVIFSTPGSPNNMTVVTTAQTADASVSNGRVLMEIDNSASPTLNTDLTAEVTTNGGTNWASATLSSVGIGQSGRLVVESADTATTAGTSVQARIKTLNNKNIPIHGLSLSWH